MKMKEMKRVTVTFTLLLLCLALVACSGNNNSGSNVANAPGLAAGEEKETDGSTMKPEISITLMRSEHPSQAIVADSLVVQEILKRHQIKLDLQGVPQSNYDDKKKTLIATNTIPDIILVNRTDLESFANSGIFLELTPYLEKGMMPNLEKLIEEKPDIHKTKIGGKLYGFPLMTKWNVANGQLPMIRLDILEELKLEVPETYDDLYKVLKAMKAAYPDSYPYTSRNGTEGILNPVAYGFGSGYTNLAGTKLYYDPQDGQYKFGPFSPEFKEAMLFLNKLYLEGLLDPDYIVNTSQIWQERLSSGRSFYYSDNITFGTNFNTALQAVDPKAKFGLIPTLTAPNGTKRSKLFAADHTTEMFVISGKVKDPERLVELLDWFYSEEGTNLTNFGLLDTHYTVVDGVPTPKQDLLDRYADKQDPLRAMSADLGLGYLGLGLNYDNRFIIATSAQDMMAWSNLAEHQLQDGISNREVVDPPFDEEQRELLKQLRSKLDAYLVQHLDKFIMVEGAIDKEWDGFILELEKIGAQQVEDIYNEALRSVQ